MLKDAILILLFVPPLLVNGQPEVKLGGTRLIGRGVSPVVDFFGSIPYAEPPVGAFRLRKPVLKTRLVSPSFNASSYGKSCVQPSVDLATVSEDCLTINVFRPKNAGLQTKLPVLFWTYGGGFYMGSSSMYNATNLVGRSVERGTPVVYVSFNYRLGPLGYPQGKEADERDALNLGLHDQIAALTWVQSNIHLFGGDRDKVTMFGESAGAIMTAIQLLNPEIGKLARGAILQSGSASTLPFFPPTRNQGAWQNFVGSVPSCASVASSGSTFSCLRNATSDEVISGLRSLEESALLYDLSWTPSIHPGKGSVYPNYASHLYATGQFSRLPFIAGVNRDEGTLFARQSPFPAEELKETTINVHAPASTTEDQLNATISRILDLYPEVPSIGSPYGTGDELFGLPASFKRHASLMGDLLFHAPRRNWAQTAAKCGVKSYCYLFTHPQPVPVLGVPHVAEIPFVYGEVPEQDQDAFNLSTVIMDYWISFAVSLDPNDAMGEKRPHWPEYTIKKKVLLQLEGGNTTTIPDDFRKEQIEYLNKNARVYVVNGGPTPISS